VLLLYPEVIIILIGDDQQWPFLREVLCFLQQVDTELKYRPPSPRTFTLPAISSGGI
jgi:hypothetical protein